MTAPPGRTARALWRLTVVFSAGLCALVSVLPDPSRPVLVAAAVSLLAAVVAASSGWQPAGDAAVGLVSLTVLLAAALDGSGPRAVAVVVAGPLVLLLVTALDRGATAGRDEITVLRAPAVSRLAPAGAATGSAVLVAVTAAQHVVPSVRLVLVGLAAAVTALVVAARAHRN